MAPKNDTPAIIVALLITLGLIGGVAWWVLRAFNLSPPAEWVDASSPSPNNPSLTSPASPVNSPEATASLAGSPASAGNDFASVQNVPSGLFNYGGSTTWAPIRGQIDPVIQSAWPEFRLRYTNPTTGTPGSGSGIRMLLDGQLAIAQSSRPLTDEEYQKAQNRGFTLESIPVALEGIAIAANPQLNVPGLTIGQLRDIYAGRITNWRQVGGPNLPIVPLSRRVEDGGTVEFFVENVMGGDAFGPNVRLIPTTTEALRQVANNPGGIYYASAPEVVGQCTTRPLPLGRQPGQFVPPYQEPIVPPEQCPARRNQINVEGIRSGDYPITRTLFVIVKQDNQATQQAGESYANLMLTEQGQTLLEQIGFVRIR